jgi:predicted secreted protein
MTQNTITLNAQSSELILQDKANVTLKVVVLDKTRNEVQKELKTKSDALFQYLKKSHKTVESHTMGQQINDHYILKNNKHEKDGFAGSFFVGLISYDFAALNKVIDGLGELAEVESINTSISFKLRKEKEDELTKKAIQAFGEKANLITTSFGFQDYSLGEINVSESFAEDNYRGIRAAAAGSYALSASFHQGNDEEPETYFVEPRQERVGVTVNGTIVLNKHVL